MHIARPISKFSNTFEIRIIYFDISFGADQFKHVRLLLSFVLSLSHSLARSLSLSLSLFLSLSLVNGQAWMRISRTFSTSAYCYSGQELIKNDVDEPTLRVAVGLGGLLGCKKDFVCRSWSSCHRAHNSSRVTSIAGNVPRTYTC